MFSWMYETYFNEWMEINNYTCNFMDFNEKILKNFTMFLMTIKQMNRLIFHLKGKCVQSTLTILSTMNYCTSNINDIYR